MESEIVVGTVRAESNGRHIVVRRDGSTINVRFEGATPLIGGDVVGKIAYDQDGQAHMELKRSVMDMLLESNSRIIPIGTRPDLTVRLLAKVLARSKSAVMSPGTGISIERMPTSNDKDLAWAMATFQPEAERLGLALNVIDVQAVAKSAWEPSKIRDLTLPADIEGNRRSMHDLTRLLRSGFTPECSRMIEQHSGHHEISVNFVLPYSPFKGAIGFASETARMFRTTFPVITLSVSETRRLSSAKYVALALAHNRLGAGRGIQADVDRSPRAAHIASCFADAAATLAFIASGGRRGAIAEYADLKEASLHFGYDAGAGHLREGVLVDATHRAIRAAAATEIPYGASAKEIVSLAVRIARRQALPASRFAIDGKDLPTLQEQDSAKMVAGYMSRNLTGAKSEDLQVLSHTYREEVRQLVQEHERSDAAMSRLALFARTDIPSGMNDVFDDEIPSVDAATTELGSGDTSSTLSRDRLATRIRSRESLKDDEDIQFGEAIPGL